MKTVWLYITHAVIVVTRQQVQNDANGLRVITIRTAAIENGQRQICYCIFILILVKTSSQFPKYMCVYFPSILKKIMGMILLLTLLNRYCIGLKYIKLREKTNFKDTKETYFKINMHTIFCFAYTVTFSILIIRSK